MPLLAAGGAGRRASFRAVAVPGCSWRRIAALVGGRCRALVPGDAWFVAGLCSFLAAHVAYIVLFRGCRGGRRRPPAWSLVYMPGSSASSRCSGRTRGRCSCPSPCTAFVLASMAALAAGRGPSSRSAVRSSSSRTRCSRSGGSFRATSSSLHDLVVMSTYLAAQGLIALGVSCWPLARLRRFGRRLLHPIDELPPRPGELSLGERRLVRLAADEVDEAVGLRRQPVAARPRGSRR